MSVSAQDFALRLHGAFRLAISSKAHELQKKRNLDKVALVVTHMVESLSHGAVLQRRLWPETQHSHAKRTFFPNARLRF